jgi:hypothetical protein
VFGRSGLRCIGGRRCGRTRPQPGGDDLGGVDQDLAEDRSRPEDRGRFQFCDFDRLIVDNDRLGFARRLSVC